MEITIKGEPKEIAALALELQGRQVQNNISFGTVSKEDLSFLRPAIDDNAEEVQPIR